MKPTIKKILLLTMLIGICTCGVLAQTSVSGKVIDVVDGRTLILETSAGAMTAQLQFIETPEPEQPLHNIAKEHLKRLAVGKAIEFKPLRMFARRTIGRMMINGTDIGLQLLRDGAAWHEPPSLSGQPASEASIYSGHEQQAKAEKRGVWSVANLKAPWLVRAENEEKLRQMESVRRITKPTPVGLTEFQSDIRHTQAPRTGAIGITKRNELNTWVSVFSGAGKESHGLQTYSDPKARFSAVYTSPMLIDFPTADGKERLECRAIYVTAKLNGGGEAKVHWIGFRAVSENYRYSKAKSRLTLMLDGKPVVIGTPQGFRGIGSIGAEEIMLYKVSLPTIKKIGKAKSVEVRIDNLSAKLSSEALDLFWQLGTATE